MKQKKNLINIVGHFCWCIKAKLRYRDPLYCNCKLINYAYDIYKHIHLSNNFGIIVQLVNHRHTMSLEKKPQHQVKKKNISTGGRHITNWRPPDKMRSYSRHGCRTIYRSGADPVGGRISGRWPPSPCLRR